MQKISGSGSNAGEWFSAPVDARALDTAMKRLDQMGGAIDSTLLETLASRGNAFGGYEIPCSWRLTMGSRRSKCRVHAVRDCQQ